MNLNKNLYGLLLLCIHLLHAQQTRQDANASIQQLNEVVVTGQYTPQGIKKSVYNVTVIDRKQIENIGANTLADILNFNLNIGITANASTGRSGVSLFGLDAQYVTILVDNIPMVSDNGMGSNIDINQINLDQVARIEIVEGAMGVSYGANAVSGVINIILKKHEKHPWSIQSSLQEESVNHEFAFFDKGKHIQNLSIGHRLSKKWYVKANLNKTKFAGFFDDKKGKKHYKNDGLRGYHWLPKNQLYTALSGYYNDSKLRINYNSSYFKESVYYYDGSVRANIDVQKQWSNPSATDKIFTTSQWRNNIDLNATIDKNIHYSGLFSYQKQKRYIDVFNYYILSNQKTNQEKKLQQSSLLYYTKGTFTNTKPNSIINTQLGYEYRYMQGFDAQAMEQIKQTEKTKKQHYFALFGSSQWYVTQKTTLRSGIRYEYNNVFKHKAIAEVQLKHTLGNTIELRSHIGSSYRTPNFKELYYYFVDSNHDIQGNKNLKPENGYTLSFSAKNRSLLKHVFLENSLKIDHVYLKDKIDLVIANTLPLQYQYNNNTLFKVWRFSSENQLKTEHLNIKLGASLQGIAQKMDREVHANTDFLYTLQLHTAANYYIKPWKTTASILFKYNGREQNYVQVGMDENTNPIFKKSTTAPYSWLDACLKTNFLNNKLQTTIGARNLLDVTRVTTSSSGSNGAHTTTNSMLLGYGRSYYVKLLYNIHF